MTSLPLQQYGDRELILQKLYSYRGINEKEESMKQELISFVQNNPGCFKRSLLTGHVNGSAWVVDDDFEFVLLTHHAKLDKWLQLGGHSDGDPDTLSVAYREAQEESGLNSLKAFSQEIFDLDIHSIPERGSEPEHLHYDVRFLFVANREESLLMTPESKYLQWIELERVILLNDSDSFLRMIDKTKGLKFSR